MYDPKYDLPLAIGLSLVVSLTATYVTVKNSENPPSIVEGALLPSPDGELITPSPSLREPASI